MKNRKITKRYQRRLRGYRESSAVEIQAGLKRHKPGSRNPRKVSR